MQDQEPRPEKKNVEKPHETEKDWHADSALVPYAFLHEYGIDTV
jgi:hypothetical protein